VETEFAPEELLRRLAQPGADVPWIRDDLDVEDELAA